MDLIEKNNDLKEKEQYFLNISLNLENEKYLLKIFPSKDNISIILKLDKEKIKTYYYYSKVYLNEFKKLNNKNSDKNINNFFIILKEIASNCKFKIERIRLKMNIFFMNNNSEIFFNFMLRKKIVRQYRLNYQLQTEIEENKDKIKSLKKQIIKLDKIIQKKNEIIDNINNNILTLSDYSNNLNLKVKNYLNNCTNNDIKNKNKEEKENISLKENLSLKKESQKSKTDKKRKINDISKNKKLCSNKSEDMDSKNIDINPLYNKKVYETLIIFNLCTCIIIVYLLYYFKGLKIFLWFRMEDHSLMKKNILLNILDNFQEGDNCVRESIINFRYKKKRKIDLNTNKSYSKKSFIITKRDLLNNETDKIYFRKNIKRKLNFTDDIDFELIYNSLNSYGDIDSFINSKNYTEILIIMMTKDGKRYGMFTNDTIIHDKDSFKKRNKNTIYVAYYFKDNKIHEINLQLFNEIYAGYMRRISNFLKKAKLNFENKINKTSQRLLGDLDVFEIYKIKT